MHDDHTKPTVKMPQVEVDGSPESLKREILDPLMTAMATHAEETNALVERCLGDQIEIRADLAGLVSRVEALEARGSAWDGRQSSLERSLSAVQAEAKRSVDEARGDAQRALEAAGHAHNELARKLDHMSGNVEAAVLEALGKHVAKIEAAANKLTRTPQVRTAASVGGAFAGSAIVAVVIEVLKHM